MDSTHKNILKHTRCYLIGAMEFQDGKGWRTQIEKELKGRNITFFNPYVKPYLHNIPEDDSSRNEMKHWRETEQYDLVAQRMKEVRGYDLRLCDISDWFIAVINPSIASWGSAEEISVLIKQKKPIFLVIDDPLGKRACPLWLFGVLPHKYIYSSLTEAINTIKAIDDGFLQLSSDRWKLLREDLR